MIPAYRAVFATWHSFPLSAGGRPPPWQTSEPGTAKKRDELAPPHRRPRGLDKRIV